MEEIRKFQLTVFTISDNKSLSVRSLEYSVHFLSLSLSLFLSLSFVVCLFVSLSFILCIGRCLFPFNYSVLHLSLSFVSTQIHFEHQASFYLTISRILSLCLSLHHSNSFHHKQFRYRVSILFLYLFSISCTWKNCLFTLPTNLAHKHSLPYSGGSY